MKTDKKEPKKAPSEELVLTLGPQNLEYTIKFPNNGQLIDIERKKNLLTDGTAQQMLQSDVAGVQAYLYVAMTATFTVLIPKLINDLSIGNLLELNPIQSKPLIKSYEQYYNWMKEWREYLDDDSSDESEKK